ncbi:MAG: ABC transporter substrate-binding protein, partial [Deltaproteobacteria bacterium]|nr:ABC transporter substrate-binding protein [Deltaproteobacteria bacterium]
GFMRQLNSTILALLVIVATFTGPAAEGATPDEADPIKVGILLPLTGKMAEIGEMEKNAFDMAADRINRSGGIKGQTLTLVLEDSGGAYERGATAMKRLISETGVVAVTGGCASTTTYHAAAVAQELETPFLINTASADKLTTQGWSYIFRLTPPASEYLLPLKAFLKQAAKVKTAAVVFEKGPFGRFGQDRFKRLRRSAGLKLVRQDRFEEGVHDFRGILTKVKERHPDLVYMIAPGPADPAFLLRGARAVHLAPRLFFGHGPGFIHPHLPRYAGDAAEGVFSSTLWIPSVPYPGAEEFAARYEERYGSLPDYHGAQAHAALWVVSDALKRADSLTPSAVRDALALTRMATVFGPVQFEDYEDKTQQNRRPMLVVEWIHKELETVWPAGSASAPYRFLRPQHKVHPSTRTP